MNRHKHAFTLIEVLVVVAIIALLIAILMPSLARAKAMTRMVQCQSNLRQLMVGFITYSMGNAGRLPGQRGDTYADWLGWSNPQPNGTFPGRQPEDGKIWKYVGKIGGVYTCPDDVRSGLALGKWYYSYTSNLLVTGAKVEMLAGAHHPLNMFDNYDHRATATRRMKAFEGVPVLVEEDTDWFISNRASTSSGFTDNDSGWCNGDTLTSRHFQKYRYSNRALGTANIGFHDTHVGRVELPCGDLWSGASGNQTFIANNLCIRLAGRKWVSGQQWDDMDAWGGVAPHTPSSGCMYGYLSVAREASTYNVTH